MKSFKLSIFIILTGIISFTSCDSIEDAQIVADEFYNAYNNEDESKMESILDKETVIDAGITDEFYNVFEKHWQAFGKVTSYERYGFATNTNNGLTTVLLKFNCQTESGSAVYEKIRFVKRSDGYKIFQYEYNLDKSVIDKTE